MFCPEITLVTPQSQTGMIAIVISAIVAIIVVLLTQLFLSHRVKRALLIDKVEELFLASAKYAECCTNLLIWVQENKPYDSNNDTDIPHSLILELTESINKIDMICGLYFKGRSFNTDEYLINKMPIIEMLKTKKKISKDSWVNAFNSSNDHIGASRSKLHKLCNSLMKSYGY